MLERLALIDGLHLSRDDYLEDFWTVANSHGGLFWKFERKQSFSEPDDASWRALARGDADEAVRLTEDAFPSRAEQMRSEPFDKAQRVRVVGEPFSKYLRWELLVLNQWADLGEDIRVLPSDVIGPLETARPLPEVTVIAGHVAYEVLYNDAAELSGARKFVDMAIVDGCTKDIERFWLRAQDLKTFLAERPDAILTRNSGGESPEAVRQHEKSA